MKWESFFNSRLGMGLVLGLASILPTRFGRWLGRQVGGWIGRRESLPQVQAVRANQYVVRGEMHSPAELAGFSHQVFRHQGMSLFDFYHFLDAHEQTLAMVDLDPSFERYLQENLRGERAHLIVCPHVTNFDLIGRAIGLRGMRMQILSYPRPPGGYAWQNKLRRIQNLIVTPMSISAFRQAAEFLQSSGAVITGVDRPLGEMKYRPHFFGRPASLPVGHVRLALKTRLPVIVAGGCRQPDGRYKLWASDPIEMHPNADLQVEIVRNAEAILEVVAEYIRRAPEQWAMFYPVWPEVIPVSISR